MVEISASTKMNLDKLVEAIVLQAEILDLKTDFESKATGIVLESKIDVGRGPVATIIVTTGTLKKGDFFVSGLKWGKVRAIIDDKGKNINEAPPSAPVEILGINGAAKSGDDFIVVDNEKEAKTLSENRAQESKDTKNPLKFATQDSAFSDNSAEELNLIIKSDVHGSSEAIKNAISQIKHDEVKPKIILADIGMVTETDVTLAKASNAVLIAFNVKPSKEAKKLAENEKIKISSYNIIYEVLDYIKQKMSGLLSPDIQETVTGTAQILEIFKVSGAGKVAGSKMMEGEITTASDVRIIRDGAIIYTGKVGTLFREKNQVKQVSNGQECGITVKDYMDFQKNDTIEAFNITSTDRIGKPISQRQLRVGEMIKQSLSMIFIKNEAKVPNLETNTITVTEVRMSQDLKIAKAYVLPLGGKNAEVVIAVLKKYSFLIRKILSQKVDMKFLPKLLFRKDESFEYAEKIENLIKQTNK